MLTMKKARKQFANRTMLAPAFTDAEKRPHPRRNLRCPLGASFRTWVRAQRLASNTIGGSKLAQING